MLNECNTRNFWNSILLATDGFCCSLYFIFCSLSHHRSHTAESRGRSAVGQRVGPVSGIRYPVSGRPVGGSVWFEF